MNDTLLGCQPSMIGKVLLTTDSIDKNLACLQHLPLAG